VRKIWAIGVAAVLGLACAVRAQESEWRPADALKEEGGLRPPLQLEHGRKNPSLEYFRIWDGISNAKRRELMEASGNVKHEGGDKLSKNERQLLEENRDYIDALIATANSGSCEWGVAVENGWFALLPHLGFMRHTARMIRMDAFRCIDDGNYAGAAERIAAIMHASDQVHSDAFLISSLVSAAICNAGLNVADGMVKDGQMNPASARIVLAAMKAMPKDDPFAVAAAFERERYTSVVVVKKKYTGEHAGYQIARDMEAIWTYKTDPLNVFLMGMNEDQLATDLQRFDKYYDAVASAWKKPDRAVLTKELSDEVWEGQYGQAARMLAPATERVAIMVDKTIHDMDKTRASLEAIVTANESGAAPVAAGAKAK
jgi:hypothetical protein